MAVSSFGLVVACTGGPGGLGEFGDDGLGQTSGSQTTTSSGGSSGRSSGSSGDPSSSSGITTSSSSGATSSSGTTSSSSTTSSGGSSGTQAVQCGTIQCTSSTQYCVKPCCPIDPDCYELPDGSTCITGYQIGTCNSVVGTACVQECKHSTTTPYCTTNLSTSNLEGSCSTSTAARTITCTCD